MSRNVDLKKSNRSGLQYNITCKLCHLLDHLATRFTTTTTTQDVTFHMQVRDERRKNYSWIWFIGNKLSSNIDGTRKNGATL